MKENRAVETVAAEQIQEAKTKNTLQEVLSLLVSSKSSEAKTLIGESSRWSEDPRTQGIRYALKGLLNALTAKSAMGGALGDPGRRNSLRETMRNRQASVWSDEFDKGYFEVWTMALGLFDSGELGNNGSRQSVVEDPSEKKHHDEAA
ncbi:MAG: hypothetical protein HYU39_04295 [Thaumarchaeota archaeon]|nr:hypothetical protein [Nitrososphaerota archaeon]